MKQLISGLIVATTLIAGSANAAACISNGVPVQIFFKEGTPNTFKMMSAEGEELKPFIDKDDASVEINWRYSELRIHLVEEHRTVFSTIRLNNITKNLKTTLYFNGKQVWVGDGYCKTGWRALFS